ncbi:MAG: DNA-directed RNA polymerase subunit beta', partial [Candidatus Peregrinibacteria bacterium Greene0416_62]
MIWILENFSCIITTNHYNAATSPKFFPRFRRAVRKSCGVLYVIYSTPVSMPIPAQKSAATDSFDAISLSVASPEDILGWSRGEITKPETVNYRTQRAEPDGLFCERIFGPTKNFQCFCGKYKGVRYAGVVCEKCGVEVTRSIVRRERMGHINLAVPVTHIWFLRSSPSRLGLLLDLPIKTLEQIVYFAAYIVITVDQDAKVLGVNELNESFEKRRNQVKREYEDAKKQLKDSSATRAQLDALDKEFADKLESLKNNHRDAGEDLENLAIGTVLSELKFREMNMKFGHVFRAGTGAESLREIVMNIDLDILVATLEKDREKSSGQKLKKIMKRIKLVSSLKKAGIKAEWMILTRLAVIPPDLRPMVQLDGGRFAASDLNDLYRRVINRNNRLKKLMSIGAPEVICRNEKRMLQEAVDTLLNNSARAGKTLFTAGDRRKLRSLSDMLKGKQGRFRRNLLGKRGDYSGRSVIVSGPRLALDTCGLPKWMALEIFRPFVIGELIKRGLAHNIKGANALISQDIPEVWEALEEISSKRLVLLNRAPTLHRLGIQAFRPILIEGLAIELHPLVCSAFNADFDGDQMAVHLPLSREAQEEAKTLMLSTNNLLKPATGKPIINPSQDMVLGVYWLTEIIPGLSGEGKFFSSPQEALLAESLKKIDIRAKINVAINREMVETSVGRIIFHSVLPKEFPFTNQRLDKNGIRDIVASIIDTSKPEEVRDVLDRIKELGFHYATRSGITWSAFELKVPKEKPEILERTEKEVLVIRENYEKGLLSEEERRMLTIKAWTEVDKEIAILVRPALESSPSVFSIINSGSRGSWGQTKQMTGMKGLVTNPYNQIIELPVRSSYKEGLNVLEYFISTHGARKGVTDTALKTSVAGYLTRRLVDVAHDVIVREHDCGSKEGIIFYKEDAREALMDFQDRIFGRVLLGKNIIISKEFAKELADDPKIDKITIRSLIMCKTPDGVCQMCYGHDLAKNKIIDLG